MKAVLERFPEKREAWRGVSAPLKRPEPSRGSKMVKEELRSEDEEEKEERKAAPPTPIRVERGRSMGPVMPPEKRARGLSARALEVAGSEALMAEARINLAELVYAKSTAASKEAKGKLFVQIAEARNLQPFPITPEVMMEVAAVLRAADFSSGFQYLMEAKQLHIRIGHPWPENLEVCMQDPDRALGRALGPARKAEEVRPVLWAEWLKKPKTIPKRSAIQPSVGPDVWGLASAFLLREVELAHLTMEDVVFDFDKRTVTLGLSMSKTDPSGRGASCRLDPFDHSFQFFTIPFGGLSHLLYHLLQFLLLAIQLEGLLRKPLPCSELDFRFRHFFQCLLNVAPRCLGAPSAQPLHHCQWHLMPPYCILGPRSPQGVAGYLREIWPGRSFHTPLHLFNHLRHIHL